MRDFLLSDLGDRTLAACDDMYLDTNVARRVLSAWYGTPIRARQLRSVYEKLVALGLLRTYARINARIRRCDLADQPLGAIYVKATSEGRRYLKLDRSVV